MSREPSENQQPTTRCPASLTRPRVALLLLTGLFVAGLLSIRRDHPVRGLIDVRSITDAVATHVGSIDQWGDYTIAIENGKQSFRFENNGRFLIPHTSVEHPPHLGIDARAAFATPDSRLLISDGEGLIVTRSGHEIFLSLERPHLFKGARLKIADITLWDRQLAILISGRLNGQTAGTLVTYEIPDLTELESREDPASSLVLSAASAKKLPAAFQHGTLGPASGQWAILQTQANDKLTRRRILFSDGRSVGLPGVSSHIEFTSAKRLIGIQQNRTRVSLFEVDLSGEELRLQSDRLTLPTSDASLQATVSSDRKYLLVNATSARYRRYARWNHSRATNELFLVRLADWTVQATARETTAGWTASSSPPYVHTAFSADSRRALLLRSSSQVEVVDLDAWIQACGGDAEHD